MSNDPAKWECQNQLGKLLMEIQAEILDHDNNWVAEPPNKNTHSLASTATTVS